MSYERALNLMYALQEDIQLLGNLAASVSGKIARDSPHFPKEYKEALQTRLEHCIGAAGVVFVLGMAEAEGITHHQGGVWEQGLDADEFKFVRAVYHIRHSCAHSSKGSRFRSDGTTPHAYYQDFDDVFAGNNPMIRSHDAQQITLHAAAGHHLRERVYQLAQKAVARLPR